MNIIIVKMYLQTVLQSDWQYDFSKKNEILPTLALNQFKLEYIYSINFGQNNTEQVNDTRL